jgi:predicted membrane channel-forming protein YqfA (hemolysin III family)
MTDGEERDSKGLQRRVAREEQHEDEKERLEREHNELLQELRSLIPGAEVLLGFLLAIGFTAEFGRLSDFERYVYYATLVFTAAAIVLYQAPAAYHRIRFREGDKDFLLRKANREAIAGTVAAGLAITGVLYLVTELVFGRTEAVLVSIAFFAFLAWRWWLVALYRSLAERPSA